MPAIDAFCYQLNKPMKTITSRDNPTYRDALKLLRKKYRDEKGMYLVEGIKPMLDALKEGIKIRGLFVRDGRFELSGPEEDGSSRGIILQTEDGPVHIYEKDCSIWILAGELFDKLADTENSQGVIAQVEIKEDPAEEFFEKLRTGNILVLDRIQDPGNAGTMIRTAEAAGFDGIAALKGTVDIYSPKVVRAAAGSLFRMSVLSGITDRELIGRLKNTPSRLAITSADGGSDCFEADLKGPIALAIGNEGRGVSESLMDAADIRLMIPMEGKIESLNAAVAAGILMYQINNRKTE